MSVINQKIIGGVLIAAVIATVIIVVFISQPIHTSGVIASAGIEIYQTANLGEKLTQIDWGTFEAGGGAYIDCWIKNTGNVPVTLKTSTNNYLPLESQTWLTLTSNITSTFVLQQNSAVVCRLTLLSSPLITGITNFSFDVIVTATGQTQSA